jgi:hypothetical protein
MHTLLSTMTISQEPRPVLHEEGVSRNSSRSSVEQITESGDLVGRTASQSTTGTTPSPGKRFFVGQWLDVKDTVNQWLEATVMDLSYESGNVFVHYNGWPARWDEWISVDSTRIAPFRTRTVHSNSAVHISPTPNAAATHAPITGRDDVRAILPEITAMLDLLAPALNEISGLADSSIAVSPDLYDRTEGSPQVAPRMPWRSSPSREMSSPQMRSQTDEDMHAWAACRAVGSAQSSSSLEETAPSTAKCEETTQEGEAERQTNMR